MDERTIDQVVDLVIKEIRKAEQSGFKTTDFGESPKKQKVLLVFNGVPSGLDEVLGLLGKAGSALEYYVVMTESAVKLLDKKTISSSLDCIFLQPEETYQIMTEVSTVIFPNLSQNTAAKAVRGIRDSIGSDLFALSLIGGKTLIAVTDGILSENMPQAYRVFCSDILVRLSRIGANVMKRKELQKKLEEIGSKVQKEEEETSGEMDISSKKLVSTRDIEEALARKVTRIMINTNTIVTPLARDMVSENKLSLVRA